MANTLLASTARNILHQALASDYGIVVQIESPIPLIQIALRAKQVLYRFKAEDSTFALIQIRISPDNPDSELWLINQRES